MLHNKEWLLIILVGTSPFWSRILFWVIRATIVPIARTIQDYWRHRDPSESWAVVRQEMDKQLTRLKDVRFDDLGKYDGYKEEFLVDDRRAQVGVKTMLKDDLLAAVYVYGWLRYFNTLERSHKYEGIGYVRRRDGVTGPLPWRGRVYMRNSVDRAGDYRVDELESGPKAPGTPT